MIFYLKSFLKCVKIYDVDKKSRKFFSADDLFKIDNKIDKRREAFRRFSLLSKKETEVKKEKSFVFSKFFSFFLYYHCPF